MTFEMECAPRFDYGREKPTIEMTETGGIFRGSSMNLAISALGAAGANPATEVLQQDGGIKAVAYTHARHHRRHRHRVQP